MPICNDNLYLEGVRLAQTADRVEIVNFPVKSKYIMEHHALNHDIAGKNWCGLAAACALTGSPSSVVRTLIRKYRAKPTMAVTGTTDQDMEYVFKKSGFDMSLAYLFGGRDRDARPMFARWLRDYRRERQPNVGYLVALAGKSRRECGHWGIVLNEKYIDNHTKDWVTLKKAPHRRRRVDMVFAIRKVSP